MCYEKKNLFTFNKNGREEVISEKERDRKGDDVEGLTGRKAELVQHCK